MPDSSPVMEYPIGGSGQVLVLTGTVLDHLSNYRQTRWYQREAGGQLFARVEGTRIVVEKASGPRKTDIRKRHLYIPDKLVEQEEVNTEFTNGLQYIGEWHTHPELSPKPSWTDITSISQRFLNSKHRLNGFVLVIIGSGNCFYDSYVAIYSNLQCLVLTPTLRTPPQGPDR